MTDDRPFMLKGPLPIGKPGDKIAILDANEAEHEWREGEDAFDGDGWYEGSWASYFAPGEVATWAWLP